MPSTYQPGIPTGFVNLDLDYVNLRNNFLQINTTYATDHVPLTDASNKNGYHTDIHLVSTANPPATVADVAQIYSNKNNDGISDDTSLYFLSGNGNRSQLTRNFQPIVGANGSTFLPGGIIYQWGVFSTGGGTTAGMNNHQTGTILFATANINFSNNCYMVNLQLISQRPRPAGSPGAPTDSSNNSLFVVRGSVSNLGFKWKYNGESDDFNGFYWNAIGN